MIQAEFFRNTATDHITQVRVRGHAGYDESGKDILCASVSSLFIAIFNSLESYVRALPKLQTNEDESQFSFDEAMLDETQSLQAQTLMYTFLEAMRGLAKEHNEYIEVTITEGIK